MLCGFREVSRFVKTTRIHLKQATYLQCTVEIGHFALYPVRLKSISDPFKNIRNETIYQCDIILGYEKGRMAQLFLPRNLQLLLSLLLWGRGGGGVGLVQISERYVHVYHF